MKKRRENRGKWIDSSFGKLIIGLLFILVVLGLVLLSFKIINMNLTGRVVDEQNISESNQSIGMQDVIIMSGNCPSTMLGSGTLSDPCIITNCTELQNMNLSLGSNYSLGNDIDCSATRNWNSGKGFIPIGDCGLDVACHTLADNNPFSGNFNGNGKTISNLVINLSANYYVGLFGYLTGNISNIGLLGINITGNSNVGGLVGRVYSSGRITSSYSTGEVWGIGSGGLVGVSFGLINNSYSTANVSGSYQTGGLAGVIATGGEIANSYSTGSSISSSEIGGLVGYNENGLITNSFWDKENSGCTMMCGNNNMGVGCVDSNGKTTTEMKILYTYGVNEYNWDISGGQTDLNTGYPYLSMTGNSPVWLIANNNTGIYDAQGGSMNVNSCGNIISSGIYTLTAPVSSRRTCITISADNVVLDGNGEILTFNTEKIDNSAGILISGARTNITIKNFNNGIIDSGGNQVIGIKTDSNLDNSNIENNNINTGYGGIWINGFSSNNIFNNNTINANYAIVPMGSSYDRITSNTINGYIDYWGSSDHNTLANNIINSFSSGIWYESGTSSYDNLTNNTIITYTYGVKYSQTSSNNILVGNIISSGNSGNCFDTGYPGATSCSGIVYGSTSTNDLIDGNNITAPTTGANGIRYFNSFTYNHIINNYMDTTGASIADMSSYGMSNCDIINNYMDSRDYSDYAISLGWDNSYNNFIGNTILGGSTGLWLSYTSSYDLIYNNTIIVDYYHAIELAGSNNVISNNNLEAKSGSGIIFNGASQNNIINGSNIINTGTSGSCNDLLYDCSGIIYTSTSTNDLIDGNEINTSQGNSIGIYYYGGIPSYNNINSNTIVITNGRNAISSMYGSSNNNFINNTLASPQETILIFGQGSNEYNNFIGNNITSTGSNECLDLNGDLSSPNYINITGNSFFTNLGDCIGSATQGLSNSYINNNNFISLNGIGIKFSLIVSTEINNNLFNTGTIGCNSYNGCGAIYVDGSIYGGTNITNNIINQYSSDNNNGSICGGFSGGNNNQVIISNNTINSPETGIYSANINQYTIISDNLINSANYPGIIFKAPSLNNIINNSNINAGSSGTCYDATYYCSGIVYASTSTNDRIDGNVISALNNNAYSIIYMGADSNNNYILNNIINSNSDSIAYYYSSINDKLTNNSLNSINGDNLYITFNITNLTLEDQAITKYDFWNGGDINFINSSYGEISLFNISREITGTNLIGNSISDIQIGNNFVYIDSSKSGLNKSANITLYNLPSSIGFINQKILRDGFPCNSTTSVKCSNFSALTDSNVSFNVSSWSNYSIYFGNDVLGPEAILSPENNSFSGNVNQNFSADITDNTGIANATLYIKNESGIFNSTFFNLISSPVSTIVSVVKNLVDGIYTWWLDIWDISGNRNITQNNTLRIDSVYPAVSMVYPTSTNYNHSIGEINYTTNDNIALSKCWYSNDSGINNYSTQNAGLNFTNVISNEGGNSWNVYCNDSAGNINSSSVTFVVDTTAPIVSLNSPANGLSTTSSSITFSYTVRDSTSTNCSLILDGTIVNFASSVAINEVLNSFINSITVGSHTWTINCTDSFNNVGNSSTRSIIINAIPTTPNTNSPSGGGGVTTAITSTTNKRFYDYKIENVIRNVDYNLDVPLNQRNLIQIPVGSGVSGSNNAREDHYIELKEVKQYSVIIEIRSNPINVTFIIGDEKKFDLNNDMFYDLYVKLNSIVNKRANITVRNIHEEIKEGVSNLNNSNNNANELGQNVNEKQNEKPTSLNILDSLRINWKMYLIFGIFIIIILVTIIFYLVKTINRRKEIMKLRNRR